jgi:hypothetical protein
MKTALKIIGIIIAVILAAVIVAAATVPLWFPVKKVKAALVELIEEKTGRNVEIKELQFNLLKGFELKGFSMKESARYGTKRDFIKDDSIVLRYNLPALIGRELIVEKFELVAPYVEIVKEENGRYNFSDILDRLAADKEKAAEKTGKTSKPAPVKTPVAAKSKKSSAIKNIIITSVGVKDGNFVYADYSKPKVMSLKVLDFNFNMDNMVLAAVKPIGLSLDCTVFYNDYKIPVSVKSSVSADILKKTAVVDIASFSIGGINTSGRINITDFKDAKGSLTSVSNVKKMLEVLPPDLAKQLKDVNASIDVINSVNFTYIGGKTAFNDVLKLENGELTYKDKKFVEKMTAKFNVTSKYELSGSVNLLLAGNEVKIKAEGANIDEPADSTYRVSIYSPKFAIEYLLAMFPKKEKKKDDKQAAKLKKAPAVKKEKKKITGTPGIYLDLKADSIFYKDITIGKTIMSERFVKGKLYSEFSMMCYQGSINADSVMDINTENYTLNVNVKNVQLNNLIDDAISVIPKKDPKKKNLLDDMKDKVYGSIDMPMNFSGSTFSEPALTIEGSGSFRVKNGKIAATDTGKGLSDKMGMTFLSNEIPFDTMDGKFTMAKGRINIKDFEVLNGPNGENGALKIRANGWTTVDRELDFKVETDINPKEAKQIEEYFARNMNIRDVGFAYNKDGWMPFDVRIYGTMADKKYDLSQKRMTDNIARNLAKKAEDAGKKYIEDKGKELIKNLFGK